MRTAVALDQRWVLRGPMLLNYNHLYYFHVAAVEGTVAAAAQRLGVTPATVSEQLRALERVFGVELFERTQAGLKLTDAGRLAFEHTGPMFRLGERLVNQLMATTSEPTKVMRIGISIGVARSTATTFILPLFQLPDTFSSVRTDDAVELLRDLRGGLLDLVLCEGEPPVASRRGLAFVEISRTKLVAIASTSLTPAPDWRDTKLLNYRPTTSYRRDVEDFLEHRGLKPMIAGEVDDTLLLIEAVAAGGHIAIVPSTVADEAVAAGRIRILATIESANPLHAIYQDSGGARRAVEALTGRRLPP
ncbi:MAG: LysR family transcriptional regulator [Kofleriaceae bacterium]|nr:LysR family transcriptional regulator [Kofleriaceae bacterium]